MRICSFLPSATEIVYALGLGDNLVGVTHECDYPPETKEKLQVIASRMNPGELKSKEIDEAVSESIRSGKSIYIVDKEALREANPDIILTQELCKVCTVTGNEVVEAVKVLGHLPQVISLEPKTLDGILDTILQVGEATGRIGQAERLVDGLRSRIEAVKLSLSGEKDRKRVLCLEWLDPLYVAGHWVPEMVEIAGGICGIGKAGEPSFRISWDEVLDFSPQIVVVMPCGFDVERTLQEIDPLISYENWHRIPAARRGHVYLVDANSYFSRPGPRVVDGLEILARVFHPEIFTTAYSPDSVLNLRNYMHFESFLG
jgi:iron complex transport system substrate-binding protein